MLTHFNVYLDGAGLLSDRLEQEQEKWRQWDKMLMGGAPVKGELSNWQVEISRKIQKKIVDDGGPKFRDADSIEIKLTGNPAIAEGYAQLLWDLRFYVGSKMITPSNDLDSHLYGLSGSVTASTAENGALDITIWMDVFEEEEKKYATRKRAN